MSADSGDFSGDLRLDLPRRGHGRRGKHTPYVRPGGLRATNWVYTQGPEEEEKGWTVEEDPPPQIVTLIALWEFCRMLLLIPVCAVMVIHPHAQWSSWYFWRIYFIASNGSLSVSWISMVSFVYAFAMGLLIWNTVKASRWVLVGTSLYSALMLGRFLYLFSDYAPNLGNCAYAGLGFLQDAAYALIGLNLIIAIGLAFTPGVADAFNRERPIQPSGPKASPAGAAPVSAVARR